MVLEVRESNSFIQEGGEVAIKYFAMVLVITIILLVTVAMSTDRMVLRRLHDLDDQMMVIGDNVRSGGSIGAGKRVAMPAGDELGDVALAANTMLDRIAEAEALLLNSERRYRAVVHDQPYFIMRLTKGLDITFANEAWRKFCGADEMEGSPLAKVLPPEVQRSFGHAAAEFAGEVDAEEMLSVIPDAEGRERQVSWSLKAIRGKEGELLELQAVGRDITEQLRLEAEITQAQKMEAIGKLAAGVAHDFNNMFTSILAGTERLKRDIAGQEKASADLVQLEGYLLKASMLSKNLLIFSRGGEPIKKRIHTGDFLREAVRISMVGSSISYGLDVEEEIDDLEADPGQLFQAINNLLGNARQALEEEGLVTVVARNMPAGPQGRWLSISISDDGPGIPVELRERIFEPFFTTKENGSGIGLVIVRSVVEAHGGRVLLTDAERGTCFELQLPSEKAVRTPEVESHNRPRTKAKVLLMDDDTDLIEVISSLLRLEGLEVSTAANGQEAIDMYAAEAERGHPFDVVVMDLTVRGGMGGREASKLLKQSYPEARIIVSSGYSDGSITANFKDHGFDAALPKPYQIRDLVSVVTSLLQAAGKER